MKFLVITHVYHSYNNKRYYGYSPYVKEMNIWFKHIVGEVIILAPLDKIKQPGAIDIPYEHPNLRFVEIPSISFVSIKAVFKSILQLPVILFKLFINTKKADHIHLRCPGNIGLLGCFIQVLFPLKKKTAKYAGNWDWKSKQPFSYRIQQFILRNTLLTHNMTALVYGEWEDRTKNIKPFFTASYSEKERLDISKSRMDEGIKLTFVGSLIESKNPLIALEVLKIIKNRGIKASLTICGDGKEKANLVKRIAELDIYEEVMLLGNVNSEKVKEVLRSSHFLVFASRSEGWPKAVAEAMWWGCLPLTTNVSCVSQMLNNGKRGEIVSVDSNEIATRILNYLAFPDDYYKKTEKAVLWARTFTMEKFEKEVTSLI